MGNPDMPRRRVTRSSTRKSPRAYDEWRRLFHLEVLRAILRAGYGDCAPWYIGEDRIFTGRGGYEQSWSFVGPCEELMNTTIEDLLKVQNRERTEPTGIR